jgi:hypothetical protein
VFIAALNPNADMSPGAVQNFLDSTSLNGSGDNSSRANTLSTWTPLLGNAVNSFGVGETTATTPDVVPVRTPETQWGAELSPYTYNSPSPNDNTVTSPDRAMQANVNAPGTYVDPMSGQTVPAQGTLAADHVIPQSWTRAQPGFDTLTADQQSWILNNPAYAQGLPQTFNSSKGPKQPDQWTTYKGQPLNQEYMAQQALNAAILRAQIQQQISILNAANQSMYQYNINPNP